jgi:hypothetical protein
VGVVGDAPCPDKAVANLALTIDGQIKYLFAGRLSPRIRFVIMTNAIFGGRAWRTPGLKNACSDFG